jgi:hypothetical protein
MAEALGILDGAIEEWKTNGQPIAPHVGSLTSRALGQEQDNLAWTVHAQDTIRAILSEENVRVYQAYHSGEVTRTNCKQKKWIEELTRVEHYDLTTAFGVCGPAAQLLKECLVGVSTEAGEARAAVPPDRKGTILHLYDRWRGHPRRDEKVSHEDIMFWAMEHLEPAWLRKWSIAVNNGEKGPALPMFGSDPVLPFLRAYARKLGPPSTKAPWILREAAKR